MRIDTFQNFYVLAIKRNKGNPQSMSAATMTILSHYKKSPSHEDCPQGKDSWCCFNRDKRLERMHINLLKTRFQTQLLKLLNPSLSDWEALVFCRLLQTVALKMLMNRFIIQSGSQLQRKLTHPQTKPNVHYSQQFLYSMMVMHLHQKTYVNWQG